MRVIWIIGSTSAIGNFLFQKLSISNKVICFSKSFSTLQKNIKVDISNELDFTQSVNEILSDTNNYPDSIIFLQRFRDYTDNFLIDFNSAFSVEIEPVLILRKIFLDNEKFKSNINFFWFNSTASFQNHIDISDCYHLIKANCARLCKLFSFKDKQFFTWITITLGEIIKHPISNYPNDKLNQFSIISKFSNGNSISTLNDLLSLILFLSNIDNKLFSGENFNLNRGLNNLSSESLLRNFQLNDK
jgi:hypothetical protein